MITDGIYIFDCEVFAHDWLFVFKSVDSGAVTVIHNDNEAITEFMKIKPCLCGFNNKHYDNHILKAVAGGFTPEEVKEVNDLIIVHGLEGWQVPSLKEFKYYFDSFDLMDDTQAGTSLKSIEAHLGMPIEETEVDFNIDRELTFDELQQTIAYCKYDVEATEKLFYLRQDYLKNKVTLGTSKGYSARKSLYMTNAKLTGVYLDAVPPAEPYKDQRDYVYPPNLKREYIPQEVFDFFDRRYDKSISDEEFFSGKMTVNIGNCPVVIGFGGIHGAIPNFIWKGEDRNVDTTKKLS